MTASRIAFAGLIGATLALAATADRAQAQSFYEGKTINLLIGYGPGAGYDAYGRLMARHMGRHIPGNPSIIPQNMPGAGSIKAAGYIYSVAPKDGTAIGIIATAAALDPLYTGNKTLFDPARFTWIGNLDETIGTCAVWHTTGIKTLEDMRTRETLFGGSGPAAINSQHAAALKNLLGLKIKLIQGYNGALATRLVMPRGEIEAGCGFALSSLQAQHTADYRDKRLVPVVQLAIDKHPELEGVTHVYDYAKTPQMRQVFDLVFGSHVLGRPFVAPPDMPADRVKVLQAAFDATMKDPEFIADAAKQKLEVEPVPGDRLAAILKSIYATPKPIIDRIAKILEDTK